MSVEPSTVVTEDINDSACYRVAVHETAGVILASVTAQDLSINVKGMTR